MRLDLKAALERVRAFGAAVLAAARRWRWRKIGLRVAGAVAALCALLALFLALADWNALRGPIGRYASGAAGRPIELRGDLNVRPFSLTPKIMVEDLEIGNTARFRERGRFANVRRAEAEVRLLPLLTGRLDIVRLSLEGADIRLHRDADGRGNWSGEREGEPLDLPAIRRLSVRDGALRYVDDRRKLDLAARFETAESDEGDGGFALTGAGSLNRRPFALTFSGAPLVNVRRARPYPFELDVRMADTRVAAKGVVARPFDLARLTAQVNARGPDLANLYYLTGLTLPNTPPYRLSADLERAGPRTSLTNISGIVGDSDLAGALTATKPPEGRLRLTGDLRSRKLDFDDLVAVLGGAPDAEETASAAQKAEASVRERARRLLPEATLDISRVRNMDAAVTYEAARVESESLPVRGLEARVTLDRGLLRIDPLGLTLAPGRLGGAVQIDAREAGPPRVALDMRLSGARIESFFKGEAGARPIAGALAGRAQLIARGASVREAAAAADGRITLFTPSGEVREAFAELTGVNVTRGLGLLLTGDQSKIDIRCGVADFAVRNGEARGTTLALDTETMLIGGSGGFSLREERLALRLQGEPKSPRLLRVAAPVTIGGPISSPRVGVDAAGALGQGGLAALLGAALAPLAAVLPFVDAGGAEDADCAALVARAKRPS